MLVYDMCSNCTVGAMEIVDNTRESQARPHKSVNVLSDLGALGRHRQLRPAKQGDARADQLRPEVRLAWAVLQHDGPNHHGL